MLLGLDYLDLWLIEDLQTPKYEEEILITLNAVQEKGKSNVAGHKRDLDIAIGQVISLDFVQTSFLSPHDLVRVCKKDEHENCSNKIFDQNFHLIF